MTVYHFDQMPAEPDRTAVLDWLTAHGIDPNLVAVPGWIEPDPARRRINYLGYEREEVPGQDQARIKVAGDDAVRINFTHQLEAAPLPFPQLSPPCAWCTTRITDRSPSVDFCSEHCARLWRDHQNARQP